MAPQIFYNVPQAPGVPPMLRSILHAVGSVQGVVAGIQNTVQFFQGRSPLPQWGVFDADFNSVLDADNFMSFSNENSADVSRYPIQRGSFRSFNKVVVPYQASIVATKSGKSVSDRAAFLAQCDALFASLKLVTIVTPEKAYPLVNLEHYSVIRKDKDDAFFLTHVELFFTQIQPVVAVFANTTNAKDPQAQPPSNQGIQAPTTPTATVQSAATSALARGGQ